MFAVKKPRLELECACHARGVNSCVVCKRFYSNSRVDSPVYAKVEKKTGLPHDGCTNPSEMRKSSLAYFRKYILSKYLGSNKGGARKLSSGRFKTLLRFQCCLCNKLAKHINKKTRKKTRPFSCLIKPKRCFEETALQTPPNDHQLRKDLIAATKKSKLYALATPAGSQGNHRDSRYVPSDVAGVELCFLFPVVMSLLS